MHARWGIEYIEGVGCEQQSMRAAWSTRVVSRALPLEEDDADMEEDDGDMDVHNF